MNTNITAGAARQGGNTSEENGAGDLTDEQIIELHDSMFPSVVIDREKIMGNVVRFARAAIAAHLAKEPKAEQLSDRMSESELAGLAQLADRIEEANEQPIPIARSAARAIDRLLEVAHLARQVQSEPKCKCGNTTDVCAVTSCENAMDTGFPEVAPAGAQNALPQLAVWEGPMPESNGKSNFTAVLHRKDSKGFDLFTDGFQFARSEYPDRVRYEADFMRWLIGEQPWKPELWDKCYDMDKHSGYVKPSDVAQNAEAIRNQALVDAIMEAINHACSKLPVGYEVILEMENGAGGVVWTDDEGERYVIDGEGYISQDIHEAVERAINHAALKTGTANTQEGGEA